MDQSGPYPPQPLCVLLLTNAFLLVVRNQTIKNKQKSKLIAHISYQNFESNRASVYVTAQQNCCESSWSGSDSGEPFQPNFEVKNAITVM